MSDTELKWSGTRIPNSGSSGGGGITGAPSAIETRCCCTNVFSWQRYPILFVRVATYMLLHLFLFSCRWYCLPTSFPHIRVKRSNDIFSQELIFGDIMWPCIRDVLGFCFVFWYCNDTRVLCVWICVAELDLLRSLPVFESRSANDEKVWCLCCC